MYTPEQAARMAEIGQAVQSAGQAMLRATAEWKAFEAEHRPVWDAEVAKLRAAEKRIEEATTVLLTEGYPMMIAALSVTAVTTLRAQEEA